jgi:hypothetical protein
MLKKAIYTDYNNPANPEKQPKPKIKTKPQPSREVAQLTINHNNQKNKYFFTKTPDHRYYSSQKSQN